MFARSHWSGFREIIVERWQKIRRRRNEEWQTGDDVVDGRRINRQATRAPPEGPPDNIWVLSIYITESENSQSQNTKDYTTGESSLPGYKLCTCGFCKSLSTS